MLEKYTHHDERGRTHALFGLGFWRCQRKSDAPMGDFFISHAGETKQLEEP